MSLLHIFLILILMTPIIAALREAVPQNVVCMNASLVKPLRQTLHYILYISSWHWVGDEGRVKQKVTVTVTGRFQR